MSNSPHLSNYFRPRAKIRLFGAVTLAWFAWSLAGCVKQAPEIHAEFPAKITFNEHVRPIFTQHCTACHGGVKNAGGVSFIYQEAALGLSQSGKRVIVPGEPNQSELYRRITATNQELRMPPAAHGEPLGVADIKILETWIKEGAQWEEHWAYQTPVAPKIPQPQHPEWPRGDIDRFVLAQMQQHDLAPNPEATKSQLLRRVSLDLTGLPPSLTEVERFIQNTSPTAYEQEVDRLLASSRFGERWATPWLDLARYADSMGYERDPNRNIWGYRDWVIRVMNEDMPFDEFTVTQLAGDLKPKPSLDDLVATAFHRNSKTNVEGGTDDEEYRLLAVMDRVSTTWQSWMGTTFGCVQCHSHPYDPFPHESYYEFLAYFDNTLDHNLTDDFPVLDYAIQPEDRERAFALQQTIRELQAAYVKPFQTLSNSTAWTPWRYQKATATQGAIISIERDEQGRQVLQTGPNAPKGTLHTLLISPPATPLQALRIDAPMLDGATVTMPGDPFVLSYLEAAWVDPEGAETPISFERVISDEIHPRSSPELSLVEKNAQGWSNYPKQHYPGWAVFVPTAPVTIPKDAVLKIVIHNTAGHDGGQQPVLRRFRLSSSDDPAWAVVSRSDEIAHVDAQRTKLAAELADIETSTVPIMGQRPEAYARQSNVFIRGDWLSRGDPVKPKVPDLLKGNGSSSPQNRLELAQWIVSDDNPLTARFTANRIWEQMFGRGIVETLEDFGSPGIPPTHPELLDYLALHFQGPLKWSRKALIREIALSATYRQSARVSPAQAERDPRNTWLSRAPKKRLTAEMTRDNALAVSGLLSDKMYGKPVMPLQPDDVWRTVYNKEEWKTSEGEDRHRRAIYTYWKRSNPYPSFITFDAPSRDTCAPRRLDTNTPLQALVTLNDPVFFECAAHLAELAIASAPEDSSAAITHAYRLALQEDIAPADLIALQELYESFAREPDTAATAAMTFVCNAILNLDAFLTR
jgi:hypothetical protein